MARKAEPKPAGGECASCAGPLTAQSFCAKCAGNVTSEYERLKAFSYHLGEQRRALLGAVGACLPPPVVGALAQVCGLVDDAPVEAGKSHPAETRLEDAFQFGAEIGCAAVMSVFFGRLETDPLISSELLYLASRMPRARFRHFSADLVMIYAALCAEEDALRESATRAAENWSDAEDLDPSLLGKLVHMRALQEPVQWLREYMQKVARGIFDPLHRI